MSTKKKTTITSYYTRKGSPGLLVHASGWTGMMLFSPDCPRGEARSMLPGAAKRVRWGEITKAAARRRLASIRKKAVRREPPDLADYIRHLKDEVDLSRETPRTAQDDKQVLEGWLDLSPHAAMQEDIKGFDEALARWRTASDASAVALAACQAGVFAERIRWRAVQVYARTGKTSYAQGEIGRRLGADARRKQGQARKSTIRNIIRKHLTRYRRKNPDASISRAAAYIEGQADVHLKKRRIEHYVRAIIEGPARKKK